MTAKNENTNGQEPIMLRMRSAARSPTESWSPDRTPGCLCQWVCQALLLMATIVAEIRAPAGM